jgi:predicted transposase YbfD/YdcC
MSPSRRPSLSDFFEDLDDHREPGRNFRHPFINVLVTAVIGIACGQKTFTAVADFVDGQLDWFGRFLDMRQGAPSEATYRRVFEALNPAAFERCFRLWVASIADVISGEVVALDGKTIRNSGMPGERAIHLVSAWATSSGLVLGQLATDQKSNEITAIPLLVEALALKGCLVTIDAMGCQREIANTIIEQGADYLLAVKDNQPTLHDEMKEYFLAYRKGDLTDENMRSCEQADKGHGRLEVRRCFTTPHVKWFENAHDWPGLASFAMIESERTLNGKTSLETRYFISSLPGDSAERVLDASRAHWGVENRLHWCLDVTFGEDKANIRLRRLAENFSITRRIALNALRRIPTFKGNLAQAGRKAAFNFTVRDSLMNSITSND